MDWYSIIEKDFNVQCFLHAETFPVPHPTQYSIRTYDFFWVQFYTTLSVRYNK
jgi:hypothetical protein